MAGQMASPSTTGSAHPYSSGHGKGVRDHAGAQVDAQRGARSGVAVHEERLVCPAQGRSCGPVDARREPLYQPRLQHPCNWEKGRCPSAGARHAVLRW